MKNALKIVCGALIGITFGFILSGIIVVLFTDITLSEFVLKLGTLQLGEGLISVAISLLSLFVAVPLQVAIHEGGHLLFGLMTGYRFVSFRLFSWTRLRESGKWRIKRFSIAGTGGQCLLTPPEMPYEDIPVMGYHLGGVIANLTITLFALWAFITCDNLQSYQATALIIFILIGAFFILTNGIPLQIGGINNDGRNAWNLRHNSGEKRSMAIQLKANALNQQGVRPKELPDEWFTLREDMDYKNPTDFYFILLEAARLMDGAEWEKAYVLVSEAYRHKAEIMPLYVKETACELVFLSLITHREKEAEALYTNELKRYVEQFQNMMSSKKRLLFAVALYMDKDETKAYTLYNTMVEKQGEYLMQGEVKSDLYMMQYLLKEYEHTKN